jgi:hypothetical protein
MRIRDGRFVSGTDTEAGPTSAVINETLAKTLFPDRRAVGQTFIRIGSVRPHTVVGVVADVRQAGPQRPSPPAVYLSIAQAEPPVRTLNFVLRSRAPNGTLARDVRRAVSSVDIALPAFAVRSGADLLKSTIAMQRFNLLVVTVFAVFALALALSGLHAVLLHAVEQTRRESGIRMALGATAGRIIRTIGSRALVPTIAGIAAGTAGAAAASELIASLLFGVRPSDPLTLAAAASAIFVASIIAVLIPASKAARGELVTLLRHE